MGGIWSPPIKLLDGVWFGLDKGPASATSWIGPARRLAPTWAESGSRWRRSHPA